MTERGRQGRAPGPFAQGRSSTSPNEDGLRALGDLIGQKPGRQGSGRPGARHAAPRSRRRHRLRRAIFISLAVLLVLVGGGAGYVYYVTHDLNRTEVHGLSGALTTGREAGTENILMAGSTSRCALKVQNPAYGLCSQGVNGVNSDVIMILHVDPAHHRLALLSIPRDLFIPNARSNGANKVDAALYQGMSQLVAAIEEDFGIPIQHAVSLNFDQFANIVEALGGINMSFPISVFDQESGLNVKAATCVHLNGTQALEVVRARHLQYDAPGTVSSDAFYWPQEGLSDLARIRRDHEFLRVLASAVAKHGLGNPISDLDLIDSVKGDLTFDQSWSVHDMANVVLDFHAVDINAVPQLTLPVALVTDPNGGASGDYIYRGVNVNQVEFPAQSQDQAAIEAALGIGANIDPMTGDPLPAASSIMVSVVNGSGATNQATDTAAAFAALGFQTVGLGDAPAVGDLAETVVYYGSRSPAIEAAAQKVVRSMTGSVIMAYDPSQVTDGAEVTVLTGTQFAVNTPATATAPTTTTTTVPTDSAIAAPSPTTSKLEPWDPRACAPTSTPTAPVPNET
jgi:LCP family protein required for cell wall assembly